MPRVWVVVLGDVGRSPRMLYHTRSLCQSGFQVDLVGQQGSPIVQELQPHVQSGQLKLRYLPELPPLTAKIPVRALRLAFKALYQLVTMAWLTWVALPRPDHILLQIPPAIPTMMVLRAAALLRRARLVFDWHNFGFTIMALSLGERHWLVKIAERYEKRWAPTAAAHLCVSRAMAAELRDGWGVHARVLHDRPNDAFARASPADLHALVLRHRAALQSPLHAEDWLAGAMTAADARGTPWTQRPQGGGAGALRPGRPALVVSSTSWTDDEDFGVLLKAAELYEQRAQTQDKERPLPRVVFLITGKGANKAAYEALLRRCRFRHVAFRLLWLPMADYRLLLGCADLGVCLHASSSGVDLPMKVVDMFGAGLPVLAADYPAITELVLPERNGLLFSTPETLAGHLVALLPGAEAGGASAALRALRDGAALEARRDWRAEWLATAKPLFEPGDAPARAEEDEVATPKKESLPKRRRK